MAENKMFLHLKYKFDKGAGPVSLQELQSHNIASGNCRLQVQDYYYTLHSIYLKPEEILLPDAFKKTGTFVKKFEGDEYTLNDLKRGDIIYAEKLRNKKDEYIYKDKTKYINEDEWILYFHTAIYLGILDEQIKSLIPSSLATEFKEPVILHSSFISGGTDIWPVEKFLYYYKPVAAKRIIQ